jgi:signal transduction histidine kinase
VRFEAAIDELLTQSAETAETKIFVWQQLIDLLAQQPGHAVNPAGEYAWRWVKAVRPEVPIAVRLRASQALAGLCSSPDIIRFFAGDLPVIGAPILSQAQLSSSDWRDILPFLPVSARALLRNRRDMEPAVRVALAAYGAHDFALPDFSSPASASPDTQADAEASPNNVQENPPLAPRVARFRFVVEANGHIVSVAGAPAPALIGINLTRMSKNGRSGVDGYASAAFRAQAGFREAHLWIARPGPVAGDWLISCLPQFSEKNGRFLGYIGFARRPRRVDRIQTSAIAANDLTPLSDGMRHFLHEVRTPLNAIRGFSEFIAAQLNGPVGLAYRQQAQAAAIEANKVADMLDDIQLLGRLAEEEADDQRMTEIALMPLMMDVGTGILGTTPQNGVALNLRGDANVPRILGDEDVVRALVDRFCRAMVATTHANESVDARLISRGSEVCLTISRSLALRDVDDARLFDLDYEPPGAQTNALLLGFGFTLRLVRGLANLAGARLEISRQNIALHFPVSTSAAGDHMY